MQIFSNINDVFYLLQSMQSRWLTELKKEMNMEIRKLEKKEYAGRRFTVRYQTTGYFEIREVESGFSVEYQHFEAPV